MTPYLGQEAGAGRLPSLHCPSLMKRREDDRSQGFAANVKEYKSGTRIVVPLFFLR